MDAAFGDTTLQKTEKTVRNEALIASVATTAEPDHSLSVKSFADAHRVGMGTIHHILHEDEDLGLEKNLPAGYPNCCRRNKNSVCRGLQDFVTAVHRHSIVMLDNIVTMDETMVLYHMPETKKQSKQWIAKGK